MTTVALLGAEGDLGQHVGRIEAAAAAAREALVVPSAACERATLLLSHPRWELADVNCVLKLTAAGGAVGTGVLGVRVAAPASSRDKIDTQDVTGDHGAGDAVDRDCDVTDSHDVRLPDLNLEVLLFLLGHVNKRDTGKGVNQSCHAGLAINPAGVILAHAGAVKLRDTIAGAGAAVRVLAAARPGADRGVGAHTGAVGLRNAVIEAGAGV